MIASAYRSLYDWFGGNEAAISMVGKYMEIAYTEWQLAIGWLNQEERPQISLTFETVWFQGQVMSNFGPAVIKWKVIIALLIQNNTWWVSGIW